MTPERDDPADTQPLHPDWLTATIAPTLDPAARFEQLLDELARILDAHGYTASMVASLTQQTAELRITPTAPAGP